MSDRTLPGIHPERDGGRRHSSRWAWFVVAAAGVLLVVVFVFSALTTRPSGSSTGSAAESDPSRYTQTWNQKYSETTCAEWSGQMSAQQQFAASADMLASIWGKIEKSDLFPPDSLIREFQGGIGTACVINTSTIDEMAVLLYQTEPRFAPSS